MAFEIVLLAIGSVASVATAAIGWKKYQRGKSTPPALSFQDNRSYQEVDASTNVGSIATLRRTLSTPRPEPAPAEPRSVSVLPLNGPRPAAHVGTMLTEDLDEYVEVEPGSFGEIHVELRQGDVVKGIVREQDGYDFDFYVLDEENFVAFCENLDWEAIHVSEDQGTHRIDAYIPNDDVWYFVFEAYGKQYSREIEVSLRRTTIA